MILRVRPAGPPPGSYEVTFRGVEQTPAGQYGPGLRWLFLISAGPLAGQTASRITGVSPTTGNACGKMLRAVAGRTIGLGDEIDLAGLIGRQFLAVVAATDNGGTRVETVMPLPPPASIE